MEEMNKELVYNPQHYNRKGRKECWDEMKEIFGADAVAIFDVLSAYKYHYRAGVKVGNPKEQDLAKIGNYMNHAKSLITTDAQTMMASRVYGRMNNLLNK